MYNELIAKLLIASVLIGTLPIMIEMAGDYLPKRKKVAVNPDDYERFQ